MAFDQSTRNRLHRFVSQSRAILMEEFTRQLQAAYGMDPANGTVADVDTLSFLDNEGQQTAVLLRETLAHYAAAIPGKSEKEKIRQGLDRIIREQSFTVLNRLAALRMAEARGFLIESISRGTSSKGFQLYKNLAGTALGETGDAYRCFLFSLFDEFSLDLAVLFDRHSVQGRLFPREAALLALLEQINHFEIEPLWAEDETIGWIYQYFNSQEERKQMRKASQAPRNSRELAVRNQFFTPRYVVEFLTDNTLGRIWYDMTHGHTALKDICRYLVRRPNEIFLAASETAPETAEEHPEALSREELLQQPVYVPFRKLKDPRELRMLDPACGSMHFGLYAFDLFETIYEEAWHIETDQGPDVFDRSTHLKPLQETYSGVDEFKKAIPQLIIEQNIHGVDIDPRAVQIAGLSLWQRAQRAWHQMGIKPGHRPSIRKSNIVCSEPMPGEKELLREFTAGLNPPVLGQLMETIFDKMQLAGEAGTLLKIEQEIISAISDAKDAYSTELLRQKEQEGFLPGMAPKREPTLFDFAELQNDSDFWETAEEKILTALKNYAAQAESHEGQKRLFAEDAAKGFAFIDLCRKRFDVVLMNPPFGAASNNIKELLIKSYENSKNDIFCCFVDRGNELLLPDSLEGSITNRTCFFLDGSEKWREELFGNKVSLKIFADLGDGVLDAAMVETAAYIIKKCKHDFTCITIRVVDKNTTEKKISLSSDISKNDYNIINLSLIQNLPGKPFAYWIGNEGAKIFQKNTSILENGYTCQQGIITANDERFLRLKWETPAIMDKWSFLVKGGDYSLFYSPIYLSVLSENGFKEIDANANQKYPYLKGNASSMLHLSPELFISAGIFYTRRTSSEFSCRILRRKTVYSDKGPAIQPTFSNESKFSIIELLGIMNSSVFRSLLSFGLGATGAAARSYETGLISKIPLPKLDSEQKIKIADYVSTCLFETMALHSYDETDSFFSSPFPNNMKNSSSDISIIFHELKDESEKIKTTIKKIFEKIDKIIWDSYSIAPNRNSTFSIAIKNHNFDYLPLYNDLKEFLNKVCSYCVGVLFKRWDYDKIFNNPKKNIDIFDETPKRQPGFLCENETISVIIFSNDEIARGTKNLIHKILSDFDHKAEEDFLNNLNSKSFNEYFNFPQKFFSFHLKQYSKSRRQAPIYWPLQTPSGSYTLWVYYHRLTNQTLYTCVNDFVEPKLKIVTDDLTVLRSQTTRSSAEEKELARLSDLEGELKNFRDELLRIAGFWKPDLNDGVQITAAPLWKLFQHRQWQNKLKDTWKKLENGEYDWAHLASSIWPERVLRKCHSDRSLAIAHDVEKDFWEEMEVPVIRRGKDTGKTKLEWQPKPLTEDGLQELIHQKMAAMRSSH